VPQNLNDPRPFQGRFVIDGLRLATLNLSAKFEVSIFIHYECITGNAKCGNGVVWGSWRS